MLSIELLHLFEEGVVVIACNWLFDLMQKRARIFFSHLSGRSCMVEGMSTSVKTCRMAKQNCKIYRQFEKEKYNRDFGEPL